MARGPRRLLRASAGALLALLLGAGSVASAPATQSFSFSRSGFSATVSLSGECVDNGDATTTCSGSGMYLFAGKTHEKGQAAVRGVEVCYYRYMDTFSTAGGDGISSVSEDGCATDLGPGSLTFTDLSGATLSPTAITLQGQSCEPTGCVPTTTRDILVSGTWTGAGEVMPQRSRSSYDDGICSFRDSFRGSSRQATFSGTINGQGIESTQAFLQDGTQSFSQRCSFPA